MTHSRRRVCCPYRDWNLGLSSWSSNSPHHLKPGTFIPNVELQITLLEIVVFGLLGVGVGWGADNSLARPNSRFRRTESAPSYATVKNWVAQFKRGDFSTCDAHRPGRPKTVTTPEVIDQIHELILEDRRISAKSIAEQLGNSRERVGSIIHDFLNMRKISAKCFPRGLNAGQKRQR